jgi:hypothetical protein
LTDVASGPDGDDSVQADASSAEPPRTPRDSTMTDVLEITTFALAPGVTADDFVVANTDINEYLERQPGFQWRRIVQRGDGTVVDIVAYDSLAHARAGAGGITDEMADSPVHDAIDHATVDWQLTTVVQHVEPSRTGGDAS